MPAATACPPAGWSHDGALSASRSSTLVTGPRVSPGVRERLLARRLGEPDERRDGDVRRAAGDGDVDGGFRADLGLAGRVLRDDRALGLVADLGVDRRAEGQPLLLEADLGLRLGEPGEVGNATLVPPPPPKTLRRRGPGRDRQDGDDARAPSRTYQAIDSGGASCS